MKTFIKYSIITAVALLLAIQAYAADAGSVLLIKGQLKIQKADSFEIIEKPNTKIDLMESDQIHTAGGTRAKVFMRGQKEVVHLYARSFLTLEKVDDEKSQVSILLGKARFVVEPSTSQLSSLRRKFQIRTSNTFIGIRGTDLVVQTNGIATDVLTVEGVVGVANLSDLDTIVKLEKNQATRTTRDATPTPAVTVPATAVEQILTTDEATEWEGVEFGDPPETKEESADDEDKDEPKEDDPDTTDENLEVLEEASSATEEARDQVKEAAATNATIDLTITEQGSN